jgi:hypothetical protein
MRKRPKADTRYTLPHYLDRITQTIAANLGSAIDRAQEAGLTETADIMVMMRDVFAGAARDPKAKAPLVGTLRATADRPPVHGQIGWEHFVLIAAKAAAWGAKEPPLVDLGERLAVLLAADVGSGKISEQEARRIADAYSRRVGRLDGLGSERWKDEQRASKLWADMAWKWGSREADSMFDRRGIPNPKTQEGEFFLEMYERAGRPANKSAFVAEVLEEGLVEVGDGRPSKSGQDPVASLVKRLNDLLKKKDARR